MGFISTRKGSTPFPQLGKQFFWERIHGVKFIKRWRELAACPKGLVAFLDRADERLLADGLEVVGT